MFHPKELHQNQAKYFAWEICLDVNGEDIYNLYSSTFQKIRVDTPMCWLHPDGSPDDITLEATRGEKHLRLFSGRETGWMNLKTCSSIFSSSHDRCYLNML